jgi:alpha-D-xyloside xylohydrolase
MIPMSWDDGSRTLTIGAAHGSFPGTLRNRVFRVVLVKPGEGTGLEPVVQSHELRYAGRAVAARL